MEREQGEGKDERNLERLLRRGRKKGNGRGGGGAGGEEEEEGNREGGGKWVGRGGMEGSRPKGDDLLTSVAGHEGR